MAKPNAGMPQVKEGKTYYSEDAETFAGNMKKIRVLGVEVIGGCCGTMPEFIRRLRIHTDLIHERISHDRAAMELKKLNQRQKGGWLT